MTGEATKPAKKSLNDVRAPVMMLCVIAYCGGHVAGIPIWSLVLFGCAILLAVPFIYERRAIRGMMRWNLRSSLFGLALSLLLYVILSGTMQLIAGAAMGNNVILDSGSIPAPIRMLLEIRSHANQIPLFLTGLGGTLLLAPAEEIFWRGFVLVRFTGRIGSILGTALVTGLYGGFWALLVNPLAGGAAALAGLVFAVLTLRSNTLVPAIISHGVLWLIGLWIWPLY